MTSLDKLIQKHTGLQIAEQHKEHYTGPIVYRGQQISWKNSIKRVVKTLRRALDRSQFASLNVVGIPGSGKTTCVTNIITDLIEDEDKETNQVWHVHWKGPEDLRNLGDLLENLEKFQNHIVIFDDVSKALEQLSGPEQSEVFEQLTTTRHTTGGRLLMVSLYHYTFANLKSVKSQGVVVIYTSCTLTEYSNIMQMLPTKKAQNSLKRFARIYEQAFMRGEFFLKIHELGEPVSFIDGHPFRPCFVVNLFKAHLCLFMKLESGYHPPAVSKQKLNAVELVAMIRKAYGQHGIAALKVITMQKGQINAVNPDFIRSYKYVVDLSKSYHIHWPELTDLLRNPNARRLYRKKKEERKMTDQLVAASKKLEKAPEPENPHMIPKNVDFPKIDGFDENLDDEF